VRSSENQSDAITTTDWQHPVSNAILTFPRSTTSIKRKQTAKKQRKSLPVTSLADADVSQNARGQSAAHGPDARRSAQQEHVNELSRPTSARTSLVLRGNASHLGRNLSSNDIVLAV